MIFNSFYSVIEIIFILEIHLKIDMLFTVYIFNTMMFKVVIYYNIISHTNKYNKIISLCI